MQYLNGSILCVPALAFIQCQDNPNGIMPKGTYDSLKARGKVTVHGRGGNGREVLIEFESLPPVYKALVIERICGGLDPYEYMAKAPIRELIKPDPKAIRFFDSYVLPDGRPLKEEHRVKYPNDAAILNAFVTLLSDKKKLKASLNISIEQFWQTAGDLIKEVSAKWPNTLPTSERRLKPVYKAYKKDGYGSLISAKYGNENNKKVDDALEALIISIYVQNNKPYATDVRKSYAAFLNGTYEVVDVHTGELFNRADFIRDGQPIEISDTTVWLYINKPMNRITVDRVRTGALEYSSKNKPHVHRHAPVYSLSKVTMDDISLPFKMADGTRAWSYQIFDVASGCIIGVSFGKDKNRGLFTEAVKDMFRRNNQRGWGVPAEIEVEQHISNTFAEDLLKEGSIFPFVRFCRGGNPQEKRAEGMIKGKKYSQQNKREGFQRRPFAKLEANRMNEDQDKVRYSFDEICANELRDIQEWNNSLHHNQQLYPGLTRMQVLEQQVNPDLVTLQPHTLAQFVGESVATTIRRTMYVTVKYGKYMLPSPEIVGRLKNLQVTACYIPDVDGLINEVHLYQDGEYICTCKKVVTFNESRAERTEADEQAMHEQFGYIKQYDAMVKKNLSKLTKVKVVKNSTPLTSLETPDTTAFKAPETTPKVIETDTDLTADEGDYWERKALEDL